MRLKPLFTRQIKQVNQKRATHDLGTSFFEEPAACLHRAASGQQVIHQQNTLSRLNSIHMDLEFITAVLKVVSVGMCLVWKFPGLSYRYETNPQFQRQRRTENEPSRLSSGNHINLLTGEERRHGINRSRQRLSVS